MNKEKLIEDLEALKVRLFSEVRQFYVIDNITMGEERLNSWFKSAKKILSPISPELFEDLKSRKYDLPWSIDDYSPLNDFDESQYQPLIAFIDSLITDIQNDEFDSVHEKEKQAANKDKSKTQKLLRKAFIVHGHDNATKERTARFLEKLSFEAVILHEQASGGKTIIEKLEHFTDVGFAIVLYTPDDQGASNADVAAGKLKPRGRQNVVFEHGLLIGKLTRAKVFPLVTDSKIELPNDISGVVYLSDRNWELDLAKEIRAAGFEVDLNKL